MTERSTTERSRISYKFKVTKHPAGGPIEIRGIVKRVEDPVEKALETITSVLRDPDSSGFTGTGADYADASAMLAFKPEVAKAVEALSRQGYYAGDIRNIIARRVRAIYREIGNEDEIRNSELAASRFADEVINQAIETGILPDANGSVTADDPSSQAQE
jgi:hypothetical protein